ncbi:glutamyl-tRNA reductase [Pseudactinotalea sp. HY158]|uniref:glutamyl-tRNA reductase n=1 Tax=Pseudactinotalea sp. HY158 TaxID=2654547 RepID=UPI0018927BC7|nr:glutamyl-tRNA reductase [Pseudactinotalea sp. HY158]
MLVCLSVSFRTAGFDVLDRLTGAALPAAELLTLPGVRGAVAISTCNRLEAYLDVEAAGEAPSSSAAEELIGRLARSARIPPATVRAATRLLTRSRVPAHLFAVASGLESVAVGEVEIAGQVRRSAVLARESGTMTPELERLFQMASTTSRRVRTGSGIDAVGRSLIRLALDLAESRIRTWREARIVLVGTGSYARAALVALRERGAGEVDVVSPSGREATMAGRDGAVPRPWERLAHLLAGADLLVTSTVAPATRAGALPGTGSGTGSDTGQGIGPVVGARLVAQARERTRDPLLVVDLGMPANVDAAAGEVSGVELLDLATIARHAPVADLEASARARDEVARATDRFAAAVAEAEATPAILALRDHVDGLVEEELARLRRRGEDSPEAERAVRHFAAMLVHAPSTRARRLAVTEGPDRFAGALGTVFGVEGEPAGVEAAGAEAAGVIAAERAILSR